MESNIGPEHDVGPEYGIDPELESMLTGLETIDGQGSSLVGTEYCYYVPTVSAAFRNAIKTACPFLFADTPDSRFCLNLFGYLAFPTLVQERTGRTVIPCRTLAVLDSVTWTTNYNAGKRLKLFEASTGVDLNIITWNYRRGLARTALPAWPEEIADARQRELRLSGMKRSKVYLDTGESYGRSNRTKRERLDFENLRRSLAQQLPVDHPQYATLELLNRQSEIVLRKIIKRNLEPTRQNILQMPEDQPGERLSKECALAVLDVVSRDCRMAYRAVDKTARVFTIGQTLHQLPRKVRKLLLSGCTTLDLKAAQLAIAARFWDIPILQQRLRGNDHWQLLLKELRLSPEHKPALKTVTYALLFGMEPWTSHGRRYWRQRREETENPVSASGMQGIRTGQSLGAFCNLDQYLGADRAAFEATIRFAKHPVTKAILSAMERRRQKVAEEGGLTTVFGKWIPVPSESGENPTQGEYSRQMRSALAQEMQAYEQHLMLPALKLIADWKGVVIISYLHDGLTLHFEDKQKEAGRIKKLIAAVNEESQRLGIETTLEED